MERRFLFLQGPHGNFFKELGKKLAEAGFNIYRINLNGGDFIDWPFFHSITFCKQENLWGEWLTSFVSSNRISDIFLYGDCRPFHKIAVDICKLNNIKVHVFEEGYIRPHWVTYELGGTNAYSNSKFKYENYLEREKFYEEHTVSIKNTLGSMLFYTLRYYFFKCLGIPFFANYNTHRKLNSLFEALLWIKRFCSLPFRKYKAQRLFLKILNSEEPYFLLLLQLDTDFQIRKHSDFSSLNEVIKMVITSFAQNARRGIKLVIKNHPLDNGHLNYLQFITQITKELGIEERVIFLDGGGGGGAGGNLPQLLDNAQGAITVNSTAGLQAIHHNVPTLLLGRAMYDYPELVNKVSLDNFWQNHLRPDQTFYRAFRKYLISETQINGSFYTQKGREKIVGTVFRRVTN